MTPPARISAAIGILDEYLSGTPLEKVLTGWGRANRYAGSGDRAAIRDLVFGAVRCRRSYGFLGGSETGRGLMIGLCRARDIDVARFFTGAKYAPAVLETSEVNVPDLTSASMAEQFDCPDWLLPKFEDALGNDTQQILAKLQTRAPVFLRVNTAKSDRNDAITMLASQGVTTISHSLSPTALEVTENPRKVAQSDAYTDGIVELQDAASQAVIDAIGITSGTSVLDYCAGGGGKGLAMSAFGAKVTAYDSLPQRMNDLPDRAARSGSAIVVAEADDLIGQKFDLVLCDVPCSGSGSWRRSPDSKWSLTPGRLDELCQIQGDILDDCEDFVHKNGVLAYVTCSVFNIENCDQVDAFLSRHPDWKRVDQKWFSPLEGGDGFFLALLTRA